MYLWIALFSLFLPTPAAVSPNASVALAQPSITDVDDAAPLRYRGIERLLAKFDAEQDAPAQR